MVGGVGDATSYGLTAEQQEYAGWVRSVAGSLDGIARRPRGSQPAADQGAGRGRTAARALRRGAHDEPPRDAAAMQLCLLREMLATVNTEAETALALQGLGSYPILQSGNDATRDRWLPGVASGDVVPAFALSEPDAGSDAGALALEARPGRRRLDAARHQDLDLQRPRRRRLLRLRPHDTRRPGARRHGLRGRRRRRRASPASGSTWSPRTPSAPSTSTASGSPRDDVLGEVDQGFARRDAHPRPVPARASARSRSAWRQAALDASLAWARERELFGGQLIDQQATQHTLAEMATRIEAGRLLVRRAAAAYDAGAPAHEITTTRGPGEAVRDRDRAVGGRPGGPAARCARAAARPPARAALS